MNKKILLPIIGFVLSLFGLVRWARQPLPCVTLIGQIDFSKSKLPTNGLLESSEEGTLGGSRGALVQCSTSQECFALGALNGHETVFVAKAGVVTPVVLQKSKAESFSQAFAVSQTGKYWWTYNRGMVRRRTKRTTLEFAPTAAIITVYRRDGKMQQKWKITDDDLTPRRLEALQDDSLIALASASRLYRYQVGHSQPQIYPDGKMLTPSAIMDRDGTIWSPGRRSSTGAISLLRTSIFSPLNTTPVKIEFPSQKFWSQLIESNPKQGVFVGEGGTLQKVVVSLLRADGRVEKSLELNDNTIVGFKPPTDSHQIRKYLGAGDGYALILTGTKVDSRKGNTYFILNLTSRMRWRTWFS